MEDEALVAAFMDATGCGPEDAFDRLASCGGHLGKAVNSFFNIDAGPSGTRRYYSPPPPPQVSVSESSSEEDAVRALPVVPARRTRVSRWDSQTRVVTGGGAAHRRSPSRSASGSSARVARWDSEAWSSRHRQRRYRRRDWSRDSDSGSGTPRGGREADGNQNRSRRRRFREDIFSSDGDEDDEESNNSRRRRRLNPTELTSDSESDQKADDDNSSRRRLNPTELTSDSESDQKADDDNSSRRRCFRADVHVISSDSDDDYDNNMLVEMEKAARRPPPPRNRTFEELFGVPQELTFKGGFRAAKAHAARRARWLLANVQSSELLPLPSLHQNRDVWGNDLVAQCVRDRFVLWQADADADEGGEVSEAKRVIGWYGIPRDSLPVVVVVDPVTGQAMDVLHGSAACEFNDFMVRLGPYTKTKPTIPVMANKSSSASAGAGAQSNTRPATAATAPTSSEHAAVAAVVTAPTCQTRQEQQAPTPTVTKPAVAVAPCTGQQAESVEEKVCKVRVRLTDGRVVTKEFGSQCPVSALFAYCRSMLGAAGGAPETTPFRLRRIVGRATEEISDQNVSFETMGLHLTTVSLHLA